MSRIERIKAILSAKLHPSALRFRNDSASHASHYDGGEDDETHLFIEVISSVFEGVTRVKRQQMVQELIRDEFEQGLHALSLRCLTPEEAAK